MGRWANPYYGSLGEPVLRGPLGEPVLRGPSKGPLGEPVLRGPLGEPVLRGPLGKPVLSYVPARHRARSALLPLKCPLGTQHPLT